MLPAHAMPLLDHIRHDPSDDHGWQVLADALTEGGDPRGEWITLQRGPRDASSTARLHAVRANVIGETEVPAGVHLHWTLGFATGAWVDLSPASLEGLAACLDAHPLLGSLSLGDHRAVGPADLRALAAVRGIDRLDGLDLWPFSLSGGESLGALLALFDEVRPRHLKFGGPLGAALATRAWLASLDSLWIRADQIDVSTLVRAASKPRRLSLFGIAAHELATLFDSESLQRCESLELQVEGVRESQWFEWFQSPAFPHVRDLRVYPDLMGELGAGFAAALVQHPRPALERLELTRGNIGDQGAETLAHSANLPALRTLVLSSNNLGEAGVRALAEPRGLLRLQRLVLDHNPCVADGLGPLATSKALPPDLRIEVEDLHRSAPPERPTRPIHGTLSFSTRHPNPSRAWALPLYRLVGPRSFYQAHQAMGPEGAEWNTASATSIVERLRRAVSAEANTLNLSVVESGCITQAIDVLPYLWLRLPDGTWRVAGDRDRGPAEQGAWLQLDAVETVRLDATGLLAALPPLRGPRLAPGEVTLVPWPDSPPSSLADVFDDPDLLDAVEGYALSPHGAQYTEGAPGLFSWHPLPDVPDVGW